MIYSLLIILGVLGVFVVGFLAGVRYCASDRMLPGVLARMSTEHLNDLAAQAGTIRTSLNKGSARYRYRPERHVDRPINDEDD